MRRVDSHTAPLTKKKKKADVIRLHYKLKTKSKLQMFCSAPQTAQVTPLPGGREFAAAEREVQ